MEGVWFKLKTGGPCRLFRTTVADKVDFDALGNHFDICPRKITLNEEAWTLDSDNKSEASWSRIKQALNGAGTAENPVQVDGPSKNEASTGLSSGVPEKLLQELTEFMALKKAKYNSKIPVQLSSVSQSIWDTLERQEGLKMMFKDIDPKPKRLSDLAAFEWDDRQERSQADRYIPHISKIAGGRKWALIDAANNHPTLLSGVFGGWNFEGTTDVAFVHRKVLMCEPRRGLRCIFELKKDLRGGREKAGIQTMICLVTANVFAQQFKPFAVLTDLDDYWCLYWMDGSTIYWHTFESSAVGCIEEFLQDSDNDEMGTSEALASDARPHGEAEDLQVIKKRRMYEPPEMDNLKDLVGLIPDEEILGAQVQLGVQQLQQLLHKPLFSGVPDVDVPWPHSLYC